MKTETYTMCMTCAEIVVQGYTDSIEDATEHQQRCNHIDKEVLPAGWYWLGDYKTDPDNFSSRCASCGTNYAQDIVTAALND